MSIKNIYKWLDKQPENDGITNADLIITIVIITVMGFSIIFPFIIN